MAPPDIEAQLIAGLFQVLEHSFVFLFFWVGKQRKTTKAKSQKSRFDTVYAFVMIRIFTQNRLLLLKDKLLSIETFGS